jgi:RNA polymerase sigma-70 factor, ECF subfamily
MSVCAKDSLENLDALFQRYSRLVIGIAWRVLGNASDAEEVLQDVFLYLYRNSELFDPSKGTLKAWIAHITFCRALDRKVHSARRRFLPNSEIDSLTVRQQTDLDEQLEAKLRRKHLDRALASLSRMQRATIECFYFEGLELREISEHLGEPLGNVRHHLYRGLKRLSKSSELHQLRCK